MVKSSKRRSQKRAVIGAAFILFVAILIVTFRLVEEIGQDRRPGDRFVVTRVIDGDTVELAGGDRLRLMAIDTPEENQPLYHEARDLLERLTLGRTAEIRYGAKRRDRYGRLLGYLYIDTLFINKVIIENGLGYLYLFRDTELNSPEMDLLISAQRRAIADKTGLFGIERVPEDHYVAGQSSFRFHRPECRSARNYHSGNSREFANRDAALREGLAPCRNCQP
jgi:micrococcal nuclease